MGKFTREQIKQTFKEYDNGKEYKASLGENGLYEQNKINERFYRGDQWHGVANDGNLPLARLNVIKRIGEYKIANITSNPISVAFSAEGVANTAEETETNREMLKMGDMGEFDTAADGQSNNPGEINFVMEALGDYFKTCGERLKFETLKAKAFKKAYIGGTCVLYTYWDEKIKTGLYADDGNTSPIMGDIACKLIDVECFYPGDPNETDIENQEYVIIACRESVKKLKAEAKANGISAADIENIKADDADLNYSAGDRSTTEIADAGKATVLIKFFKAENENGETTVHMIKATENCLIKDDTDTLLQRYPINVFVYEEVDNCFFGDSEVTYIVPNQISINRMVSSVIWCAIINGMPITVVNTDNVNQQLTNDPGQVIEVSGEDIMNTIRYIAPPAISGDQLGIAQNLVDSTMSQSGANDAALGNLRPDNTSAVIAVREAAQQPLQTVQTRFYQFCEDIARCWAEYWIKYYGNRKIKMEADGNTWYLPINTDRYAHLLINAKVDVGPASLWSELQTISTLDNLLDRQVIDVLQYLERLPKGYIPDMQKLTEEIKAAREQQPEGEVMPI